MKDTVGARVTITMKWPEESCCECDASRRCKLAMLDLDQYMTRVIDTFAEVKYSDKSYIFDPEPHIVPHAIGVTLNSELLWEVDACSDHVAGLRVESVKEQMIRFLSKEIGSKVEVNIDVDEFINESEFW